MKLLPFLLLALLTCVVPAAVAAPPATGRAAEISDGVVAVGTLRLQAHRLAKLRVQRGLGLAPATTERDERQAIDAAEAALARLGRLARQAAVQRSLLRCIALWRELRVAAGNPPAAAGTERIAQLAEEIGLQSGRLALQLEGETESPVGRLLDQSSRLNMLSQRLARLYLQALAGDRSAGRLVDLEQTRREFVAGLLELESAPDNSRATREALALARNQWVFFDAALVRLQQQRSDPRAPLNVATTSERIREVLEVVTTQYAEQFAARGRLDASSEPRNGSDGRTGRPSVAK